MDLARLVERCAEQSGRFARGQAHDDSACFELFRRAIVERETAAWEALHAQYAPLVRGWIRQHPMTSRIDDHDDLVMRVFERFWQAVPPAKFASFTHLAGLLRYLKLCVFAAVVDEVRARRSWESHRAAAELADEVAGEQVDAVVVDELARVSLWQTIEATLADPAERLVIYLSCVIGLKPREIAQRHREVFASVDEVYRRKRLALERLRRNERLRALWESGARPA